MDDRERLLSYVETWWSAVTDLVDLLDTLTPQQWSLPSDLAGWDVKALASHVAHLESVLATGEEEYADIGSPAHVTSLLGSYTEIGVVNRRDADPAAIIDEIRTATKARHEQLLADPPTDGTARPERIFGGVPWDWHTLLRNRPLDVWMHEQDIRRAVGRPGGMDTRAAAHTADYLVESFPYVVGKRVAPPAGTTAVLAVDGSPVVSVVIGDDGRARRLDVEPSDPAVRIAMGRESFVVLAGGRRGADPEAVSLTGDVDLGRRIVAQLATTP